MSEDKVTAAAIKVAEQSLNVPWPLVLQLCANQPFLCTLEVLDNLADDYCMASMDRATGDSQ